MKIFIEAKKDTTERARFDEQTLIKQSSKTLKAAYPYYYGFACGTKIKELDALDCFLISDKKHEIGDIVECEALDGFIFYEGDEEDLKLICFETEIGDKAAIKQNIERFLKVVFSEWPEINIQFGPYLGIEKVRKIIKEREGKVEAGY